LGCAHGPAAPDITVIRMSTVAPARPAGCKVEFVNAPPAAAMMTFIPLRSALEAHSATACGVRCADIAFAS